MKFLFPGRSLSVCLLSLVAALTFSPLAQAQPMITTTSLPNGTVGQPYSALLTATNGSAPVYTWTAGPGFPPGLVFDPDGDFSGTPTTPGSYTFPVSVQSGEMAFTDLTIVINDVSPPLSLATASLPNGRVGDPYAQGLEAMGGTPPYTITAQPASLPPGLSVIANELNGTPTAQGNFNIQFQVMDNLGATSNNSLPILIAPALLTIPPAELTPGTVDATYTQSLVAAGGTPPYTFSATPASLPPGISVVANQLTGKPTQSGSFSIQVHVVDNGSASADRAFQMIVFPAPLAITTATLPNGTIGVGYSQSIIAAGGTPPYGFSADPMTLPPGLSINGSKLGGTPTATGMFPIQFQVMDNDMATANKTISVTIVAADPSITTTTLPDGTVGVLYTQALAAAGGTSPYTFTAVPASLPAGLTINGDKLTGTPTTSGSFSIQFQVSDAQNATGTKTLAVTIQPATLSITTSSLPGGALGAPYSQPLAASGGVAPYSFSAIAGTLPAGLSINANQITGTPTASGTFPVQLKVTDSQQSTATRTVSLTIQSGPLQFNTTTLPRALVGSPYSAPILISGGTPPYSLTAPSTSLPQGVSIVNLTLTGTPTQSGSYSIPMELHDSAQNQPAAPLKSTLVLVVDRAEDPSASYQVNPQSLLFQTSDGNTQVTPQDIVVTSSNTETPSLSFSIPGSPAWLSVGYQPGTTPAQLRVSVLPAHLPSGTFQSTVSLAIGKQSFDIPVTLVVAPAQPRIDVAPRILQLTSQTLTPRGEALIVVRNNGGGPSIDLKAHAVSASRWITGITLSAPRFTPAEPAYITLAFDTTGLNRGAYRDEILIETSAGQFRVPVSIFVDGPGPVLDVSVTGIRLPGRQADPPTAQQTIEVLNSGSNGTVNWNASIIRGDDIFTLSSTFGTVQAGSSSSLTIGLKPNATAVAGGRSALLRIDDPLAAHSPQYVVLVADIDPFGSAPNLTVSTAGLLFIGVAGGPVPDGQSFRFSAGGRSVNYQASTSTSDGANWLAVRPSSGVIPVVGSVDLGVSVNTNGLAPGIYFGLVTAGVSSTVRGVGVTLILVPTGTALPNLSLRSDPTSPRLATATCTPARAALVQTALAESFLVPAGWPATITAKLLNDCGEFLGDGSVVASFSNGDAPIVLESDLSGNYTGTWQPGVAAASTTVRVEGTLGNLQPAVLQIVGGVRANPLDPPSLTSPGALNNFNPVAGGPLAPGTITQITGNNLAPDSSSPTVLPLPTSYKGVEVLIGGLSAPIFQVSKTQVTVQVPSELAPNQTHSMLLITDAGYTLPVPLSLVPVQPGMLLADDGTVVAQHSDGSLISAQSPALPNEAISVFLVGMGATTPAVASGTPSPNGVTVNVSATISIDNNGAEVISQGLVPGTVGLYQIIFRVPTGTAPGVRDITITQDQIPANQAKLIVGPR